MLREDEIQSKMNKQMIHNEVPNLKVAIGENNIGSESIFKNLNVNLPEFDDSALWKEAASTTDYEIQAFGDPGIAAATFGDGIGIGIEIKHPLIR